MYCSLFILILVLQVKSCYSKDSELQGLRFCGFSRSNSEPDILFFSILLELEMFCCWSEHFKWIVPLMGKNCFEYYSPRVNLTADLWKLYKKWLECMDKYFKPVFEIVEQLKLVNYRTIDYVTSDVTRKP